ncbi:MAG: tetratricopeptide repeat protein [Candidatus Latescibacteria bacterium]|nr:tetratricopeptide repeat protein [bacterium]MBD3425377.1 tetratricopeptide repeat protein [Candidatus Latescibacterota bacterium]
MARKKLDKHDLKEDPLLDFFMRAYEYIKTHQNVVFVGLIALIIIVAGSFWYRNSREAARISAANRFSEANMLYYSGDTRSASQVFELVRDNYGGTREGAYASYYLGKISNGQGEYTGAIEHFLNYLKKADDFPFFRKAAHISIAVALENDRQFEKAAGKYLEIAEELSEDDDKRAKYLRKSAECYALADMDGRAVEIYRKALPYMKDLAARQIEVKIDILSR